MKTIVTTSNNIFNELNVPLFSTTNDVNCCSFPSHIKLNKTYYLYKEQTLKAFRIIAFAFSVEHGLNHHFGICHCLVQFPNEKPMWKKNFLKGACIFENKEDLFEHIVGKNKNINHSYNLPILGDVIKSSSCNMELNVDKYGTLETNWIWDECSHQPKLYRGKVNHILYVNDTLYVNVEQSGFLSKEECIKYHLDGFQIEEFAEEPLNISMTILPNQPKIHTLKFVEL
jgi:hypothetical protein